MLFLGETLGVVDLLVVNRSLLQVSTKHVYGKHNRQAAACVYITMNYVAEMSACRRRY
jgi:hypothetical protein